MKSRASLCFTLLCTLSLVFGGCATSTDEVVKVTPVPVSQIGGLKSEDRARLEEIKKARGQEKIDPTLSAVLEETQHYNVTEYLMKHPEAGGQAGQDYRVGGYDVLSITVYEEKDLSRDAIRVSADGYLSFPLIGRVKVDNLTVRRLEPFE